MTANPIAQDIASASSTTLALHKIGALNLALSPFSAVGLNLHKKGALAQTIEASSTPIMLNLSKIARIGATIQSTSLVNIGAHRAIAQSITGVSRLFGTQKKSRPVWFDLPTMAGHEKRYDDSVAWKLTVTGVTIDSAPITLDPNKQSAMASLFTSYGTQAASAANAYHVPLELILAMIATEVFDLTDGNSSSIENFRRELSGFVDDATTPDLVCLGCTGISLSDAQTINPSFIASDLLDVATNIGTCAASIAAKSSHTKLDPAFVVASYNDLGIRYSQGSPWRMQHFDGDDSALDRYIAWFNTAIFQQRTTALSGLSYADVLLGLTATQAAAVSSYNTPEAQAASEAPVSLTSTLSPQLTTKWLVSGKGWDTIAAAALDNSSGIGLPFGASTFTTPDASGVALVTMTGAELLTLYVALRDYLSAIHQYDTGVIPSLPSSSVVIA